MSRRAKPRPIDDLLRTALWEAYGRKCAYEQETIERLRDMEVDHILPKALWEGDQRLPGLLQMLGLPSDYHPDSLDNLLPTSVRRNRQKRNRIFDERAVHYYRQIALDHQDEVERLCLRYEDARYQEKIRAQAQAACSANPALRVKLLEALEATPPFPVEDTITDRRLQISRPRAMISCELPNSIRDGSVLIRINTLYLHNVHFTFAGSGIFSALLQGVGTEPSLRQRGFILTRTDECDWVVTFNGTTIILTDDEVSQLCELIDLAAPHFLTAFLKREQADGTLFLEPDGLRNVRLMTVKRALWKAVLAFAHDHDYAEGNSAWHIFDAGGTNHIKVVRRVRDTDVIPFEAYVYATASGTGGQHMEPEDEVCLCWEESQSQVETGLENPARIRGWTASQTSQWITRTLIPEIVRKAKDKSSIKQFQLWGGTESMPRYSRETSGVDAALFRPLDSWEKLLTFSDSAQEHYNQNPHDPVPRPVIESAFAGLQQLSEVFPECFERFEYIAQKLRVPQSGGLGALLAAGGARLFVRRSFIGSDVDGVLRVAGAIMDARNPNPVFPAASTEPIFRAWQVLIKAAQFEAIRHRALARFEQPHSR